MQVMGSRFTTSKGKINQDGFLKEATVYPDRLENTMGLTTKIILTSVVKTNLINVMEVT